MKTPMICQIEPATFLTRSVTLPVIDVRAPVEFSQGHIPGAFNLPLFDDAGREAVGTMYHHSGQDAAIALGKKIAVLAKNDYLSTLAGITPGKEILLHCWRGGMRSAEMAKLFHIAGYNVGLLVGGYKAYRRYIRQEFGRAARIIVVGGFTGSGKTEILKEIRTLGEQVIDLEQIACHKGSVFGALGQPDQPTNEQFENDLFAFWNRFDFSRPVWFEDESRMIGHVTLPDPIINHLNRGLLLVVETELPYRIARLVNEYAGFNRALLAETVLKIRERLGGTRTQEALIALDQGNFEQVAAIVLSYYDKAYQHSIGRRDPSGVVFFKFTDNDIRRPAASLIKFVKQKSL